MSVDADYALWLQSPARFVTYADPALATLWGDLALETRIISPFASQAAALDEGARQMAFLGYALAEDVHIIPGAHRDKIGQVVTITLDRLGYDAGLEVFVIGAQEDRAANITTLTVLRRME